VCDSALCAAAFCFNINNLCCCCLAHHRTAGHWCLRTQRLTVSKWTHTRQLYRNGQRYLQSYVLVLLQCMAAAAVC
jgi:hypothetical protein